jgi:hypothetical protein
VASRSGSNCLLVIVAKFKEQILLAGMNPVVGFQPRTAGGVDVDGTCSVDQAASGFESAVWQPSLDVVEATC